MERRVNAVESVLPRHVIAQVNAGLVLMLGVFFSESLYIILFQPYALLQADQAWR